MKNYLKFILTITLVVAGVLILPAQNHGIFDKGVKTPAIGPGKTGPVLFDQISTPGSAFMSSMHYTNEDMETMTCAAADDFEVPEGETWDVYTFAVMGSYFKNEPGGGDTLNVFILADDNGKPGDTLYEYWAYTGFTKQEVPYQNESGDTYVRTYFEIDLPSVVTLNSGIYWLSVQMYSDGNVTGKWGWKEELYDDVINGAQWHWINPLNGSGYGYTDWTPAEVVVGPWLTWELSFAVYGEPKTNDVAVSEIISPESFYYGIPTEDKPVKVVIKNEGTSPQTGFDVKYNFNGTEVTENIGDVTLNYNDTLTYTFSQKIDLSTPGYYDFSVSTMLSGDEYTDNDTKSMDIYVFDPTIYTMPSNGDWETITACSGTFTDAGGLEGNLIKSDQGVLTIYPENEGDKISLKFIEFQIGWSDFWIYDGEDETAPQLGFWEDTLSPGTVRASYQNESGALTIRFNAQTWDPFEEPGWSANIKCKAPVENDFEVLKVELGEPAIFASDYVPVYAYIKNNGTDIRTKDVTFSVNGQQFAVVTSDSVIQSDTMVVEAIWHPVEEGDYTITATIPEDNGTDNDNQASVNAHVYPIDFFYEGFEGQTFPPEQWSQSGIIWQRKTAWPAVGEAHAYSNAPYGLVDTLKTPLLNISDTAKINFMAFSSAWWPGELDLIWIDGTTGESHFIQSIDLPFIWYQNFEIDVSMAAGNNRLGFVGKYNPGGGNGRVELDEVWGDGIKRFFNENDLKAGKLTVDNTPIAQQSVSFTTIIKNIGSLPQQGSEYTIKLMKEPGVVLASFPGVDLDAKEYVDFSFDYTFPYAGKFDCYVEVDFPEDEDTTNNKTFTAEIYVLQEGTEQAEIGDDNPSTTWFYPLNTISSAYFTQMIYYSEELGDPKAITGIKFFYKNAENHPIIGIPVHMWFKETDEDDMTGPLEAVNDATEVFNGTVTYIPGVNSIYIPLENVFDYQGGNLVVTTYKENNTPYLGSSFMYISSSDTIRVRYYSGYNYTVDPYDQDVLDAIPENQQKRFGEYANAIFYKYDLSGQYCVPTAIYGTSEGDYIDDVSIGEISNTGTGAIDGPPYNDYTGISTNLERGRIYELTVKANFHTNTGSISAWMDFNGNKNLDDEGEMISHIKVDALSKEIKLYVQIPDSAALGVSVLRIRNSASSNIISSCESVDYGETEDYGVNIIETQQVYNPVNNFNVTVDNNSGEVSLSWDIPDNPGVNHIEGFESNVWPPQGWDVKQSTTLDGVLLNPSNNSWQKIDYNYNPAYIYDGKYAALAPGVSEKYNWLIAPETFVYNNDELTFMLNYQTETGNVSEFYVRVKADGNWTTVLHYDENSSNNEYEQPVTVDLSQFAGKNVKIAFVAGKDNAYPVAIDDITLKGSAETKNVAALAGYKLFKNGEPLVTIDNPGEVSYTDQLEVTNNYNYCIKAVYNDEGESDKSCAADFYLEPLTPPVQVVASPSDNDVIVKWIAPGQGINKFNDDFESYNVGEKLACQNPDDWTTWLQDPCSNEDPLVVNSESYSGENSVEITNVADLLYKTDQIYSEGEYSINFRMYVPEGYNAYFNALQEHNLSLGSRWGMQVFFDEEGIGVIDGGGAGAKVFDYDYNKWLYINLVVDLDDDTAFFYLNNSLIHGWKWSSGISGAQNTNTFNGVDFYAWNTNNTCLFYIDDFNFVQLYDYDFGLTYNVYKDGNLITNTSSNEYVDEACEPGYHNYCISAVYESGESGEVCDFVDLYSAPENFTVELQGENDVYCSWDAIEGAVDGYYVYRDNEKVSDMVTTNNWTDVNVPGGTHIYYVTAVYGAEESLPSQNQTVVILIRPKNLTAEESGNDIVLNWDGVGEVHTGELVKLSQNDGVSVNGLYQWFNFGYGVVFDVASYSDFTLENVDFFHESWGVTGTWNYRIHIVDWETFTELEVVGPFQTTGDDKWETGIPLGSYVAQTSLIGIFLEPMSNDPQDAYPVLGVDEELNGTSLTVSLEDYEANNYAPGDFLLDLWIWNPFKGEKVKAKKVNLNNYGLKNVRKLYKPVNKTVEITQDVKGGKGERVLTGYNVYHSFDAEPFSILSTVTDTTYVHENASSTIGTHYYYVTSVYEEGESQPSDTVAVVATDINESAAEGLNIYPNPVKDNLKISSKDVINEIELLNSVGVVMNRVAGLKTKQYNLGLSDLSAGIYFVRIKTDGKWTNHKVVKY